MRALQEERELASFEGQCHSPENNEEKVSINTCKCL